MSHIIFLPAQKHSKRLCGTERRSRRRSAADQGSGKAGMMLFTIDPLTHQQSPHKSSEVTSQNAAWNY